MPCGRPAIAPDNPERQRGEAEAPAVSRRFGNPVALERMTYDAASEQVTHIPDPGQVMQRNYGWYASRTRGARRRQTSEAAEAAPVVIVEPVDWSLRAARYRWPELLRQIFEVDPLACPRCRGPMRIVAVITHSPAAPTTGSPPTAAGSPHP